MIKQLFLAGVILGASLFITENCTAAEQWVYGGPVPQTIEERAAINRVSVAKQRAAEEAAAKYRNSDPMPESIEVRAAVNQVPISEQRKIEADLLQMKARNKASSGMGFFKDVKTTSEPTTIFNRRKKNAEESTQTDKK